MDLTEYTDGISWDYVHNGIPHHFFFNKITGRITCATDEELKLDFGLCDVY
jgi:hypothetical protein